MMMSYVAPYLAFMAGALTLYLCGVGVAQQRPAVVRSAWAFGALAVGLCGRAVAGPDVAGAGQYFSRALIQLALGMFLVGVLVQWAALAAEGTRMKRSRFLGSVTTAAFGGSLTTMLSMSLTDNAVLSVVFGAIAAYKGGAAAFKNLDEKTDPASSPNGAKKDLSQ